MKRTCAFALAVSLAASASISWADPLPTELIKFEQRPMLSTTIDQLTYCGHDEESWAFQAFGGITQPAYQGNRWMADDFADTTTAEIVHIEWWGSWLNNEAPPAPIRFLVEFLSDRPDGDGPGPDYSRPQNVLSIEVLDFFPAGGHPPPGFFTETLESTCNPSEFVFRYNAHLRKPFPEEADTVYWLKIVALIPDTGQPYFWGWHNRDYTIMDPYASVPPAVVPGEHVSGVVLGSNVWHFQDNAVSNLGSLLFVQIDVDRTNEIIGFVEEPTNSAPAYYILPFDGPEGIETNSKDLAFRLFYREPPPELCAKWHQPPDCDIGVDVESWYIDQATGPTVADDFVSDGRPIDGVRWWGSYIGYATQTSNEVPPQATNRPVAFRLTWRSDTPEGAGEPFSRPDYVLDSKILPVATYGAPLTVGLVQEQPYCVSDLSNFFGTAAYEHEYAYTVIFTNEPWKEKDGIIYWLSVEAIYTNVPTSNPWGWKTTPIDWNWNDDAVYITNGALRTNEMIYPPAGWESITNHPYDGLSVNMAFELLTEICPARCKKWDQQPDMIFGEDIPSWTYTNFPPGQLLRAGDFVSDGRPITDIHWWGSYINWKTNVHGDIVTNRVAPPFDSTNRPLGFILSWHENDLGLCLPTTELKRIFVNMDDTHETYFGPVHQFWKTVPPGGPSYEHEYQYYVDLLDPDVGDGPWYETNGVRYWLNIQAVFSTNFVPQSEPAHDGWGWKIHEAGNGLLCQAAFSTDNGQNWAPDTLPPGHPAASSPYDLAFELTTTNIPGTNSFYGNLSIPTITNITGTLTGTPPFKIVSTGYCGCGKQVLQRSLYEDGDLRGSASWIDVMTNLYPRQQNVWRHNSLSTQQFYRIEKRP